MADENRVSLDPESWTEGGIIDDVDVEIVDSKFVIHSLPNSPESPYFYMGCKIIDGDDTVHAQYWSCGKMDNFVPTSDGMGLKAVGKSTGINKQSGLAILLESLLKKGLGKERVNDVAKLMPGCRFHMVRVKVKSFKDDQGVEKDRNVLVVTEVKGWSWDKKGGAAKGAAKTTAKTAPKQAPLPTDETEGEAGSGPDPIEEKAIAAIVSVLKANNGTSNRADISTPIFKLMAKDADKNKIVKAAYAVELLKGGGDGQWVYDEESQDISLLE